MGPIGDFLALLRAFKFQLSDVLEMVNHLVNQNRQFRRSDAGPTFRQVDCSGRVVIDGDNPRLTGRAARIQRPPGKPVIAKGDYLGWRREFDARPPRRASKAKPAASTLLTIA